MPATEQTPRTDWWMQAVHYMSGVSIGPIIAALQDRGVLDQLRDTSPTSVGRLRATCGGNAGYLHAALRLLAGIGWLEREGPPGDDETVCRLTPRGHAAMPYGPAYTVSPELLDIAWNLQADLFGTADPARVERLRIRAEQSARGWDLAASDDTWVHTQVRGHLDGHLACALAVALHGAGVLRGDGGRVDRRALEGNARALDAILELLTAWHWLSPDGPGWWRIEAGGRAAAQLARTYFYPVRYIPTMMAAERLLFGDAESVPRYHDSGDVDATRRQHIGFSGDVAAHMVAEPLMEVALPLFSTEDFSRQPRHVVDVGSGDGQLLARLYEAVRTRTPRGAHLDAFPLVMVGAEYHAVAQQATAETLRNADVPHLTVYGDINDPAGLALTLRGLGVALEDCLLLTKSVVHGRPYVAPVRTRTEAPATRAVFVDAAGGLIAPADMEQSLLELFEKWRPYTARHGWLLVDAHTVDSEVSVRFAGRTLQPMLDATHNFSHQYLIEMRVFEALAQEAGLNSRVHRELGDAAFGHTYMSIDHFKENA